jgi:hypothetical protein
LVPISCHSGIAVVQQDREEVRACLCVVCTRAPECRLPSPDERAQSTVYCVVHCVVVIKSGTNRVSFIVLCRCIPYCREQTISLLVVQCHLEWCFAGHSTLTPSVSYHFVFYLLQLSVRLPISEKSFSPQQSTGASNSIKARLQHICTNPAGLLPSSLTS